MDKLKLYFPELSDKQLKLFAQYVDLFLDWNSKINLVSRKDTENFVENHLLHSLSISKFIQFKDGSDILDLGTGGGLPGLPLAIFFPKVNFVLVDSIGKKIMVVNDIAEQLKLKNVVAINDRVENIDQKFDFVVSRAVAPISQIDAWVSKKIKKESKNERSNGYILLKGGDLTQEIDESFLPCLEFGISDFYKEPYFETKKIVYVMK